MKKVAGIITFILLILLVGIQFIPTNHIPFEPTTSEDFILLYKPAQNVERMIKNPCYNCHSNQVQYPWYSYFQPTGWLVDKHIKDGMEELNFSEFGALSERMKKMKIESMIKQVEQNKMPIPSYTLIHQNSKWSNIEREKLIYFLNTLQN